MRMDLAGYVVNAVSVEGRSVTEVCETHNISRSWLHELIARYRRLGEEGLKPRSRRSRFSPTRLAAGIDVHLDLLVGNLPAVVEDLDRGAAVTSPRPVVG
jgi:hypothetical protein